MEKESGKNRKRMLADAVTLLVVIGIGALVLWFSVSLWRYIIRREVRAVIEEQKKEPETVTIVESQESFARAHAHEAAPSSGLTAALPEEPQAAPLQRKVQSLAAVPVRATAGKRRAAESSSAVLVTAESWKPNLRIRWTGVIASDDVSGPVTLIAYSGTKKTQVVRTYTGKLSSLAFTAVHARGSCRAEVIANGTTYSFSSPALMNGFVGTDAAIGIEP